MIEKTNTVSKNSTNDRRPFKKFPPKNMLTKPKNKILFPYRTDQGTKLYFVRLKKIFPVFASSEVLPLQIEVHKHIKERLQNEDLEFSSRKVLIIIRNYVNTLKYKYALATNDYRYDLDGNKEEKISPETKKDALDAMKYFLHWNKIDQEKAKKGITETKKV
jgi:sRNA-binding protein